MTTAITGFDYNFDINRLLGMDESGALSGYLLQLESILETKRLDETTVKILDETIEMLYGVVSALNKEV